MNNNIVMIDRRDLKPHPDNPRKDLGDLEELRESIREHGIMQNLTVVPDPLPALGTYKILIGHRRFAASEGILYALPCVIAENLTEREQVGIMLVENMQRSDLTYLEQAHGFQMMLDLGDTVQTIAEKTGFSEKTIKARLEINKLDEDVLAEASERFQLSINDFMKLSKVKDEAKRNEILESVDSSVELADEVESYLEDLNLETNFQKYKEVLDDLGWKQVDWCTGPNFERLPEFGYGDISLKKFEIDNVRRIKAVAEDHQKDEVVYSRNYRGISFAMKVKKAEKKKTKEELRQETIKKKSQQLEHARAEICDEYLNFIAELPKERLDELTLTEYKNITGKCIDILGKNGGIISNFSNVYVGNLKTLKKEKLELDAIFKKGDPLQKLFLNVWQELAMSYKNKFVSYDLSQSKPTINSHAAFYSILYRFGFRLPENLRDVIDGVSDLYDIDEKGAKK